MMDYEVFKELIKAKIPEYLPPALKGAEIMTGEAKKINTTADCLSVRLPECAVSPSFNMGSLYEAYRDGEGLEDILNGMAEKAASAYGHANEVEKFASVLDIGHLKDNVVMALINTEQNRDYLKDKPHREFQDLSVIFRWIVEKSEKGIGSIVVTDEIAERAGMAPEELFEAAVKNTKEIFKPKVTDMGSEILSMPMPEDLNESMAEMFDAMLGSLPPAEKIYLIGNDQGINGAASMLYEDVLHKLAQEVGTDLYILPSSIHEVLAVSTEMGSPERFTEMVQEVNMGSVRLEERLSNNVYQYDKELRTIRMATDVPNWRLDGIVADQPKISDKQHGIAGK